MSARLFVGNLPFDVTEAELRDLFSPVGSLSYVFLPVDRESGKRRGFAFVEFSDETKASNGFEKDTGHVCIVDLKTGRIVDLTMMKDELYMATGTKIVLKDVKGNPLECSPELASDGSLKVSGYQGLHGFVPGAVRDEQLSLDRYNKGDYTKARSLIDEAYQKDPSTQGVASMYNNLAGYYVKKGNWTEAAK